MADNEADLAAVRRYCGWHVSPVIEGDIVTLDGPGSALLVLPTLRMSALTKVVENDVELDLSTLAWSRRGLVRKKSGALWSCEYGAITVTFTHGFTEEEAADWRRTVQQIADRNARIASNDPIAVGPFRWADNSSAAGSAFTDAERATLDLYRLERPA
ncbi:hypothetical protein [Mycolicibacterium sp.]|uniref:hypothetical protein n=1 Tax=Mycolicibacterium sp. TaxID=2320850 RepID=UPI0037C929BB